MAHKSLVPVIKRVGKVVLGRDVYAPVQVRLPRERLGSDYGGWTVRSGLLDSNSAVYSFGVGQDISFDLALIEKYGCVVHAFDPTPATVEWISAQTLPPQLVFHDYGVGAEEGTVTFYPPSNPAHGSHTMLAGVYSSVQTIEVPVRTVRSIMSDLGHEEIDLIKMDIEGAEYGVLADVLATVPRVSQILVEFHHRFSGVRLHDTREALRSLRQAGYRLFHVSENGQEFSFIRRNLAS